MHLIYLPCLTIPNHVSYVYRTVLYVKISLLDCSRRSIFLITLTQIKKNNVSLKWLLKNYEQPKVEFMKLGYFYDYLLFFSENAIADNWVTFISLPAAASLLLYKILLLGLFLFLLLGLEYFDNSAYGQMEVNYFILLVKNKTKVSKQNKCHLLSKLFISFSV